MTDRWMLMGGFVVAFVTVFLKVIQQQNVNHRRIAWAALTSCLMTVSDITLVGLIVYQGWAIAIPTGMGSMLGVTLAMYLYPKREGVRP